MTVEDNQGRGWMRMRVDVFNSQRKACRRIKGIKRTSPVFITLVTTQWRQIDPVCRF